MERRVRMLAQMRQRFAHAPHEHACAFVRPPSINLLCHVGSWQILIALVTIHRAGFVGE
ncbi:MAG UNVERIFIED_CONTAM: hypothetical protein LVT10_22130 [Anaerolineae bacterium]